MQPSSKLLLRQIAKSLDPLYGTQEAQSVGRELLERMYGCSRLDIALGKPIQQFKQVAFDDALKQLQNGMPVQYVTGWAHFYGFDLQVNKHTLIPRRETEELVQRIAEDFKFNAPESILDIGTGTGCIAIALGKMFAKAKIHALDIDPEAVAMAAKNAQAQGVSLHTYCNDILAEPAPNFSKLSIVVSNPPYVRDSEKTQMHKNVLEHEPHTALFVTDEDPLIFYRRIAALSQNWLQAGGWLYFEINEAMGEETENMLEEMGYKNIQFFADMQGKERMAKAQK
jgi:release factor glutamine methyltransferase